MLPPIVLVLLLMISHQTSPVQSRSHFRGINSDEMDTASSDETKSNNKTFGEFIRHHPYGQQRSGYSSYALIGLGQNGRPFRIPEAKQTIGHRKTINHHPASSTAKCGIVPRFNSDLNHNDNYNDSVVSNGQIPWQAAVFTADGEFLCSGVLVSPKHVLTAAICLLTVEYINSPHLLEVRVGAWDLRGMVSSSEEYQYYSIVPSQIHMYPEMNIADKSDAKTSKIALLELKEAINLTKHSNLRPICLESIPMLLQDRELRESSLERPTINIIDDKKPDGQGKRHKKNFEVKKKTLQQLNGKKTAHRPATSKSLMKDRNMNDFLDCYVSGWGSQSQPSTNFLTRQMQKHDFKERASISSFMVPIIPGGKYVVQSDPALFPAATSGEITSWIFKSTSDETATTKQEISISASDSANDFTAILQDILTSAKTGRPTLSKLDPVEDYIDSMETNPTKNTMKIDTTKATQSKSRKKQLKPEKEFHESYSEDPPTFDPIESDELLVDKQADEDEHRGLRSSNRNFRLRWAVVAVHNVSSLDNVDLALGTAYLKPARSSDPDALCMVDIGSPVVCRKRSSLVHPHSSNVQKILAGIVTWKAPCFGDSSGDIALAMNELKTNYNLAQITPINEILDFISERVTESETATASSESAGTIGGSNAT